ncbi:uncharacterized protein LOC128952680 [Oppia nitens]|uniref:uncharacterized protein LOC128952680 n=1 Tax=Oppia nitens TaxID=1686743 RepID=UPI0023D989A8|nr:uncharacterized protein LOC128952680 [Oppia nitens]
MLCRKWEYGSKIEHPAHHHGKGKGWTHTSDTGDQHHGHYPVIDDYHKPQVYHHTPKFELPKYEHQIYHKEPVAHYAPPVKHYESAPIHKKDGFLDGGLGSGLGSGLGGGLGGGLGDVNVDVDGIIDDISQNLKHTNSGYSS